MTIDNSDRAACAEAAVEAFMQACATDREDAITDLIGNLCHLCDMEGTDPLAAVRRGLSHYYAETHHEQLAYVVVRFEDEKDATLEVAVIAAALRAVLQEIESARGLKVSANGILDPLHPICVQAANARALINLVPGGRR